MTTLQKALGEAYALFWSAQSKKGDPSRNPHLVGDAFNAGYNAGIASGRKIDSTKQALGYLIAGFKNDAHFAWTWHCGIAMQAMQNGCTEKQANSLAHDVMRICFDVETWNPAENEG